MQWGQPSDRLRATVSRENGPTLPTWTSLGDEALGKPEHARWLGLAGGSLRGRLSLRGTLASFL